MTTVALALDLDSTFHVAVEDRADPSAAPATAYLWLPPDGRVRAVLVEGLTFMDADVVRDVRIRAACAEAGIAIVYLNPHPCMDFSYDHPEVSARLERILASLAAAAGKPVIATAPLIPVGHSAGSLFAQRVGYWNPGRCAAVILLKGGLGKPGWAPDATLEGVPLLHVQGQFEEFGTGPSGNLRDFEDRTAGSTGARRQYLGLRAASPRFLGGVVIEPGASHYPWTDAIAGPVATFLRAIGRERLPEQPGGSLRSVVGVVDDGGFTDNAVTDAPAGAGFWYPDRATADAVRALHAGLGKRTQFVAVADAKGSPRLEGDTGDPAMRLRMGPTWSGPDRISVNAVFLDRVPMKYPKPEGPIGHADGPIRWRPISGPLRLLSDGTLEVTNDLRWGSRCALLIHHDGDAVFRPAHQVVFLSMKVPGDKGDPQEITGFTLPEHARSTDFPMPLSATASSGLPVRFHVDHGPAEVRDGRLVLLPVPTGLAGPVRIRVVATQPGSTTGTQRKAAPAVIRDIALTP